MIWGYPYDLGTPHNLLPMLNPVVFAEASRRPGASRATARGSGRATRSWPQVSLRPTMGVSTVMGGTPSHHPFRTMGFSPQAQRTIHQKWGTPIYGHPQWFFFGWDFQFSWWDEVSPFLANLTMAQICASPGKRLISGSLLRTKK